MQGLLHLIVVTLAISPSGALSPGPLTFATMAEGAKGGGWKAGLAASIGHTVFEAPYTFALTFLAAKITLSLELQRIMSLASSTIMLFFACMIMKDALEGSRKTGGEVSGRPFMVGLLFTGLNPYFIIWWVGAGWPMISGASAAIPLGFLVMYLFHVWYDYLWLIFVATVGRKGVKILGSAGYRAFLAILALLLVVFAVDMMMRGLIGVGFMPL